MYKMYKIDTNDSAVEQTLPNRKPNLIEFLAALDAIARSITHETNYQRIIELKKEADDLLLKRIHNNIIDSDIGIINNKFYKAIKFKDENKIDTKLD